MSELATIQKWLTSIMVRPGNLMDKISAADATYGVSSRDLIVPGKLTSEERIGIYARGYVLRLMECMRADYPILQNLMGENLFDVFAGAYLVELPSHSPSLFDLGKHFPDFLEASQPKDASEMFALPLELAKLERARTEVSRMQGLEKTDHQMPDTDPMFYLFGNGRFCVSPCLRLMQLDFDLLDFMRQTEKGEEASTPPKDPNFVAVCRKNYAVNMFKLEPWQWYFLREITGSSQTEAVSSTSQILGIDASTISAELMLWLPVALQRGYVYWEE